MPNNLHPSPAAIDATDSQSTVTGGAALSSDAMARRRMLLKSLGKGSAVVAAAAAGSIHTLAGATTLTYTASGSRCSISGTISGIHSKDTGTSTCAGKNPLFYKTKSNWPPSSNDNYSVDGTSITFSRTSAFNSVFGGSDTTPLKSILYVVTTSSVSVEAVWVTALLNALPGSGAQNFPYTAKKVIDLYKSSADNPGAYTFFKDYMQTLA
jgi:hypothetical protein